MSKSESQRDDLGFDFDSMFNSSSKLPGSPVYDKPVCDDDLFEGVPCMKRSSESPPRRKGNENSGFC
ncbi:uncharacterized protein J3R85_018359 [Psidium guajava]|nr:uncharacterized protein J3R85_018359 [Psidium guajava]